MDFRAAHTSKDKREQGLGCVFAYVYSMENVAAIDLGTNTFHLLVAKPNGKGDFKPLRRMSEGLKLGAEGFKTGVMSDHNIDRVIAVLNTFKRDIDAFNVPLQNVRGVATSYFRHAVNGTAVLERVLAETGMNIRIIDGGEEVRLITKGVLKAVKPPKGQIGLVIDIGGGSTEFAICDGQNPMWMRSVEVGGWRMLDHIKRSDPLTQKDREELYSLLYAQLVEVLQACVHFKPTVMYGSSGTFDTLADMVQGKVGVYPEDKLVVCREVPMKFFKETLDKVVAVDLEERLKMPGMKPLRAEMITVACVLIDFFVSQLPIKRILVSSYALREGVAMELCEV